MSFSRKFKLFTTPFLSRNAANISNSFSNRRIKYLPVFSICILSCLFYLDSVVIIVLLFFLMLRGIGTTFYLNFSEHTHTHMSVGHTQILGTGGAVCVCVCVCMCAFFFKIFLFSKLWTYAF